MSSDHPDPEAEEPELAEVVINLRTVIEQVGDAAESVIAPTKPDPLEPVVAHGALNSMAVLLGALHDLSERRPRLDAEQTRLLEVALAQGRMVVAALHDLDLRLPMGATGVLDDLDEEARRRH